MWYSFLEMFSAISPYFLIEETLSFDFKNEEGNLNIEKMMNIFIFLTIILSNSKSNVTQKR